MNGNCAQSDACDLNGMWNDASVDGQIVNLLFEPRAYYLSSGMRFDASTRASEVRLWGNASTVLRRSQTRRSLALGDATPLLTILPGAPPVSLRGLTVQGPFAVSGGSLTIDECSFEGIHSSTDGGALALTGGQVTVRSTNFFGNRAVGNGGAVSVAGGEAIFDDCRMEGNSATSDGGALHVRNGTVVLRARTLITRNTATEGKSIFVVDGRVDYQLPCPLGRWISARPGTPSMHVASGGTELDFPYACAPGLYGSGYASEEQSGSQCSGECWVGHFCPLGTVAPRECRAGSYCPGYDENGRGATTELPCKAGTFSNDTMLSGAKDCSECPIGHMCVTGSIQPLGCSPGTYSDRIGSGACRRCPRGTFQEGEAQTACKTCTSGFVCLEGSSAPQPCPGGTHANQSILSTTGFLSSLEQCIECPAGTACPTGSSEPSPCLPGSFGASTRKQKCDLCAAGSYTATSGNTACLPCTDGFLCVEGSSAPQPCPGGTHANQSILSTTGFLSSLEQCIECPAGTACPTGSSEPSPCLPGSFGASTRKQKCDLCAAGTYEDTSGQTTCKQCTIGYVCLEGSSAPQPCPGGTHADPTVLSNAGFLSSLSQCLQCPAGTACPVGSAQPAPCLPGSYGATAQRESCDLCPDGQYQPRASALACLTCPAGRYCEAGSSVAARCAAGTYRSAEGGAAAGDCDACLAGSFCAAGSTQPTVCKAGSYAAGGAATCSACKAGTWQGAGGEMGCVDVRAGYYSLERSNAELACSPGTFSAAAGQSSCADCVAGTYQSARGQTSCLACPAGSFCEAGASAPTRCAAGTYRNATSATTQDDCVTCPAGFACASGAASPTRCLPGSIATSGQATCALCASGRYQDQYEQTACLECIRGFFCKEGSATPVPCPGGTWNNRTGRSSAGQCQQAPLNFWAPLGSPLPELCPSGFFCPGTAKDTVHDPPGSKPIIQATGGSTTEEEVPAVTKTVTVDLSYDEFASQRQQLREALALQYGVDVLQITLEAANLRRRLQSSGSGLQLTITISAPTSSPSSSGASVASSAADLLAAISAVDDAALGASLGSALGLAVVNVTTTSEPQATTQSVTVTFECPKGKWCTAGLVVACPVNTYNNESGQDFATACKLCPLNAHTLNASSTSIDDCACNPGFYDKIVGPGVECAVCPVGVQCDGGATLEWLNIRPGYFRVDNASIDVRKCPDASTNCSHAPVCEGTTSGCVGGVDSAGSALCQGGLQGIFCLDCDLGNGSTQVYYAPATTTKVATCEECGNTVGVTAGIALAVVAAASSLLLFLRHQYHRCVADEHKQQLSDLWRSLNPMSKGKILLGFYLIATRVDSVYSVAIPYQVKRLINIISFSVSFGVMGAGQLLECLGLRGYKSMLLAFMSAPYAVALLAGAIAAGCRTKGHGTCRSLFEAALPSFLRIMFLAYPIVTNAAFDAFPCYKICATAEAQCAEADERHYLKADVSIACYTAKHDEVVAYAYLAVILYPIGLLVLNAALLFAARRAIQARKPTPLSRAIGFLHKEYEPAMFWWELRFEPRLLSSALLPSVLVARLPTRPPFSPRRQPSLRLAQVGAGRDDKAIRARGVTCAHVWLDDADHRWHVLRRPLLAGASAGAALREPFRRPACLVRVSQRRFELATCPQTARDPIAFESRSDSSFCLVVVFLCSYAFKDAALVDLPELQQKMSLEQIRTYVINQGHLAVILVCALFGSLVLSSAIFVILLRQDRQRRLREARASQSRRLRWKGNDEEVHLGPPVIPQKLPPTSSPDYDMGAVSDRFHLFLSHVWGTGQDQMRGAQTPPSRGRFLQPTSLSHLL